MQYVPLNDIFLPAVMKVNEIPFFLCSNSAHLLNLGSAEVLYITVSTNGFPSLQKDRFS